MCEQSARLPDHDHGGLFSAGLGRFAGIQRTWRAQLAEFPAGFSVANPARPVCRKTRRLAEAAAPGPGHAAVDKAWRDWLIFSRRFDANGNGLGNDDIDNILGGGRTGRLFELVCGRGQRGGRGFLFGGLIGCGFAFDLSLWFGRPALWAQRRAQQFFLGLAVGRFGRDGRAVPILRHRAAVKTDDIFSRRRSQPARSRTACELSAVSGTSTSALARNRRQTPSVAAWLRRTRCVASGRAGP